MSIEFARLLAAAAGVYVAVGALFAVAFVAVGAGRIDPAAKGAPSGFRILILPGAIALWPYLLARWVSGAKAPPEESNAHRRRAAGGRG
jgi:hypothetical protein